MLLTSAGVEPTTSWSPVRRRIQLSTESSKPLTSICAHSFPSVLSTSIVMKIFCLEFYFKQKYLVLIDNTLSETICILCFCVLFSNLYPNIKFTAENCRLLCLLSVTLKVIVANRSSLIWVHTVCLYAKCKFEKFARRCSRQHKQTTFSDAVFLGALRVKWLFIFFV